MNGVKMGMNTPGGMATDDGARSWGVWLLVGGMLALVYTLYAPAVDHHFAERLPHHGHAFLTGAPAAHAHSFLSGHDHGLAFISSPQPLSTNGVAVSLPDADGASTADAGATGLTLLMVLLSALIIVPPLIAGGAPFAQRGYRRMVWAPEPPPPRRPARI